MTTNDRTKQRIEAARQPNAHVEDTTILHIAEEIVGFQYHEKGIRLAFRDRDIEGAWWLADSLYHSGLRFPEGS